MKKTWQQRLKQRLNEQNINQISFAKMMDVEPSAVGHWINSRRKPSLAHLEKASKILGVTPEWLMYGVTPHTIDDDLLKRCLAAVDSIIADDNSDISPEQKIKVAVRVYKKYLSKPPTIKTIHNYVRQLLGM